MPVWATLAARQEAEEGPILELEVQSFFHSYSIQETGCTGGSSCRAPRGSPYPPRTTELVFLNALGRAEGGDPSPSFPEAGRKHKFLRQNRGRQCSSATAGAVEARTALCNVSDNPKHLKTHSNTCCWIDLLAENMFCCKADSEQRISVILSQGAQIITDS